MVTTVILWTTSAKVDTVRQELRREVAALSASQASTAKALRLVAAAEASASPREALKLVRFPVTVLSADELRPLLNERGLESLTQPGAPLRGVTGAQLFLLSQDDGQSLEALEVPRTRVKAVQLAMTSVLAGCMVGAADGAVVCTDFVV